MKRKLLQKLAISAMLGLILPALTATIVGSAGTNPAQPETTQVTDVAHLPTETAAEAATEMPAEMAADPTVRVITADGAQDMALETYITGVVLGEMPAYFEPEALKAQAVVARTYTLRALYTGGKHADGAVCTDSSCCQAYCSAADYLACGGSEEDLEKIASAVAATYHEVLSYGGEPIEATYFACSGGKTEDAAAVWGSEVPYLLSVDSPGEEFAASYTNTVEFTYAEFADALGLALSGSAASWFGSTSYTAGGGVDTMEIGGVTFSGTQLRSLLGLNSTAFTVQLRSNAIAITTSGKGHRVGMSQYGADAMALAGSSYEEILFYYFTGVSLDKWENFL
ncbi:MAG: stage II sporulation protein D [Firmicutes bacterium]|nr:stage II sporulation protein D [Bacillota bacterium]